MVYDELGTGLDDVIAFTEGGEATQPFLSARPSRSTLTTPRCSNVDFAANRRETYSRSCHDRSGPSKSSLSDEAFDFHARGTHEPAQLKEEICDIGRRIYAKGFAAGNDGNISYRLSENQVLCTPTMICKGFIKPDDLCSVDMEGKQLSGKRKRTSEVLLHLAIMKERPEVKSVVHCHPPHATAFAVAREPIPQCVLPEVEVFLGDVPITKYETPGGQIFADTIMPFVKKANVIILANHGTVSYGETVEKAYWWTEILDAYCRILMLAKRPGTRELSSPSTRPASCWT